MAKIPIPEQEQSQRASRLLATYYLAIDKDRDYGHIKDQFDLHWYLLQERLTLPITKIEVDEVADRAQFLAQLLAEDGINRCLADIAWLRGDISIGTGEFESAKNHFERALEIYKQKNMRTMMSGMMFKIAQTHMLWWDHKVAQGFFDWQLLATAKQVFGSANDMFEDLGNFVHADLTQYYLGIICSNRLKFIDPSDTSVADECLGHLAAAISLRDRKRLEISDLANPQSIRYKQILRATEFEQDCYAEAIAICFDQKRFPSAWNWIQRNKARVLSDMLRVGVVIPEYLRVKIEGTEEMARLLCEETSLVRRLDNTSGGYSLGLRYELGMLRNRMRQFPLLAELLAFRDGKSETLEDLDWLFKNDPMSENQGCRLDVCQQQDLLEYSIAFCCTRQLVYIKTS
jgi:tetratricopeptide (TPR) repeat protein